DHEALRELGLVGTERGTLALGLRLGGCWGLQRGDADDLALLDAVARRRALTVDAQLPRARPARHDVEACVRHMALEPAIEADAIVVGGHLELADVLALGVGLGHAGNILARPRPTNSSAIAPRAELAT